MPERIQRRREKGWRMPEGAIYVGRPSPWGNPWPIGYEGDIQPWLALAVGERGDLDGRRRGAVKAYRAWMLGDVTDAIPVEGERPLRPDESPAEVEYTSGKVRRVADLVSGLGVMMLARHPIGVPPVPDIEPLRGHDLVCWCAIGQPCHADVLLELLYG